MLLMEFLQKYLIMFVVGRDRSYANCKVQESPSATKHKGTSHVKAGQETASYAIQPQDKKGQQGSKMLEADDATWQHRWSKEKPNLPGFFRVAFYCVYIQEREMNERRKRPEPRKERAENQGPDW